MLPQASDIRYFMAAAQAKNISRAAELLGISQPSLSLAIKRLETIAGCDLFIRNKNGVDLTHEGVVFQKRSAELLDLWQNISADVKKKRDSISGRYIIGAHVSVAIAALAPVVAKLMAKYADLEISLVHGLSRIITDQVINFDIDFALVVNPVAHPDLVMREIYHDQVGFFACDSEYQPDTLIYDPNLLQAQALLKVMAKQGIKFNRSITTTSLEMVATLAKEKVGVALIPGKLARGLKLVSEDWPQFHDRHCLIFRADAQNTRASRLLFRELESLLVGAQ